MMEFIDKIKNFLIGNRWKYILVITFINIIAYIYNLISYQTLAKFINTHTLISSNITFVFSTFFIKMLMIHMVEYGTSFLLERQVLYIVRGIFKNLITKIISFKLKYFKDNSTSKINQLWYYLGSVEYIIEKIILEVPRNLIYILFYIKLLYYFSPLALTFAIPSNILLILLQQPMIEKQHEYQEERTDIDLISKNRFLETTSNIEYVKLKNQQNCEIDKITSTYDKYIDNKILDLSVSHMISYTSKIFNNLLTLVIYSIGFKFLISNNITPAELIYLGTQTHMFYFKLRDMIDIYNQYKRKQSRINIIYNILTSNDIEIVNKPTNEILSNFDIEFKNVTFGYKKNVNILSNTNIKFYNKKINLLIGPNGSGKSTVIKLLLGLYDLENINSNSNIITIDGYNIQNLSKWEIRNKISFVSQDPNIFDDTVMNNVRYGYTDDYEYDKKVFNYSDLLDLGEWIITNSNKICGFMGKNLSGGEKKKIQLLNAICSKSSVIIFDEPSNALDKVALEWFKTFAKQLRDKYGKTIIIITHDARLIELSDHTVDMLLHVTPNKNLG